MRKDLLKLPLYLFLAGLLMRGITRIAVWGIMKISTERAFQMDVQMLNVQLIVSFILLLSLVLVSPKSTAQKPALTQDLLL